MTRLGQVPLDLLQESSATLDAYVRARRKNKLREERARLQGELQDMHTDLAEIQALSGGVGWSTEEADHA
jgi:hypothetical protein